MSTSPSSSSMCYAKPPGHIDRPTNAYSFPHQHDSVHVLTSPSRSYQLPPQHHVLQRPIKRRTCLCSCCLWLSALIIIFIFLTALCFFFLYIFIQPRFPEFHLNHLALSEVKLTNQSGDLLLSSQFNVAVEATNKNTVLWFKYRDFNITTWTYGVKDKDTLLGYGVAQGFKQGQKNVTLVWSTISMQSEVSDATTAKDIVDKMKEGELTVAVEVASSVLVMAGDWTVLKAPVDFQCKGAKAGAAKSGSNPRCQINSFRMLLGKLHLIKD
ncbi:hypothetical protein LUZ62_038199 [Rhynchospora pubera]|uniref:Late embryogenesis abundant protein LEA-2 subgroup domain-containing protein n=1 Tax=Rhynchospora pubera TaxID=906938 RepID=A0AAV8F823_9POAL|nr:hypothetical protein LUZ62_038199 [Rhynchospora pubera]